MTLPKPMPRAVKILSAAAILFTALALMIIGFPSSEPRQGDHGSKFPDSDEVSKPAPAPLEPLAPPIAPTGMPHETIQLAMNRCDADAAKGPRDLHFLVTPVLPVNFESATLLLPPGEHHGPFYLIQSYHVLNGVEDGSLAISSRPYNVFLIDSQTRDIHSWASTTGPAQFTLSNAGELRNFQIGLQFGNDDLMWGGEEYVYEPGACHRINVFLTRQVYSPLSSRLNFPVKSYPSPAETLGCANHVCE
jgi:hypothetical protein